MDSNILNFLNTSKPLIAYLRGDKNQSIEAINRGFIIIIENDGNVLAEIGDSSQMIMLRSCAKPFQLMSSLDCGIQEKFQFTDQELAVAAASHSSEQFHVNYVQNMLDKMNLNEQNLKCGKHDYFQQHVLEYQILNNNKQNNQINNNCSGKHSAMLAACLCKQWDLSNYDQKNHPLQVKNAQDLGLLLDFSTEKTQQLIDNAGIDGCTLPTFQLSIKDSALAFAKLSNYYCLHESQQSLAQRTFQIISQNPYCGSGTINRLEGALMNFFKGTLIAKVGAEAIFGIGIAPGILSKKGVGIIIKLEDGITFNRGMDIVVLSLLQQLGLISQKDLDNDFQSYYKTEIKSCRNQVVGNVKILFDIQFQK